MNEYQEIVDELRFILQREVIEQNAELTRLVKKYGEFCHEVNVKLRRCDEYLKQGLRSEALHLADARPNLLDAVAVLDFAEREQLVDVVNMYFLTTPEPLLLDVAAALNAAYAEHEPIKKLLDLHRLLALARGPLAQRLTVLRSLAELDATSPHWDSDIRDMERARFRELDGDSAAAAKVGNTIALKTIVAEIQSGGWRESIPSTLAREIKSRANMTVRENARQRLTVLNEELHSAFSALDAAKARPLRDEWKQKRQLGQVTDDDPLVEQVDPIFAWLEDEDRKADQSQAFSKCVAEIERAIDGEEVTTEELNRLKRTADRFERPLPPMLETRFRSRLATMETNEGRRKKLMIGTVFGTVSIVASVVGFVVYSSVEGAKSRRLAEAAMAFIDDGKLNEAQKLVDQHAARATSEAWLSVKKRIADADQAERDRVASWNTHIATARESMDLALVESALKHARELSKTTEEKIELGTLESNWQKRATEALAEREQTFRAALTQATSALKMFDASLDSSQSNEPNLIRESQVAVENQLAVLRPLRESVSKELSSQARLLESRFTASQQTLANIEKKSELFSKLSDAVLMLPENSRSVAQPERYAAILTEFIATLPDDPLAASMKAAADSNPFPAVVAYQKLTKRWGHLKPSDKMDIESRLKEIRAYLTEHPQSPNRELLGQYEAWLVSILRRFEEDGDPDEGVQRRFVALFNSKFIKEWQVLQDTDGNTYYLKETPKIGSTTRINYLVGFNGESEQVSRTLAELATQKPIAAPHQELAAKARTLIRNVAIDHWRESFREVIETLLKADKIDTFLRYLLVLKTIEFAGRGDRFLEVELEPLLAQLNDEEIDRSVPWMDPTSKSADAARSRAALLLSKVSIDSIEPLFFAANKRQVQFEQAMFVPRFSIGWLEKGGKGEWVCRTKWPATGEYTLYVVSRPDASELRTWTPAGHITNGVFVVDPVVAQSVGEASVVFASSISPALKTAFDAHK